MNPSTWSICVSDCSKSVAFTLNVDYYSLATRVYRFLQVGSTGDEAVRLIIANTHVPMIRDIHLLTARLSLFN